MTPINLLKLQLDSIIERAIASLPESEVYQVAEILKAYSEKISALSTESE